MGESFRRHNVMRGKQTKKRLLIKLSGDGVSPETVRASDLAEFLIQFEKAILTTVVANKDFASGVTEEQMSLSLVEIVGGSESLTFALTSEAMLGASLLSLAHESHSYSSLPFGAQEALYSISSQAIKNSWSVEFVGDVKNDIRPITISEHDPIPAPRIISAKGETTIYGRLIRVGGVSPKAMIEMSDKSYVFLELTESMAVTLASKDRLYKDVGIEGIATWRVDTMEMVKFTAQRITTYQPHKHNLVESFKELAKAGADRWDDVDVEQFVAELRGRRAKP